MGGKCKDLYILGGESLLQSNPHRSRHTSGTEGGKVSFHVIMTTEWASKRVQGSAERDISLEIEEGIGFLPLFVHSSYLYEQKKKSEKMKVCRGQRGVSRM